MRCLPISELAAATVQKANQAPNLHCGGSSAIPSPAVEAGRLCWAPETAATAFEELVNRSSSAPLTSVRRRSLDVLPTRFPVRCPWRVPGRALWSILHPCERTGTRGTGVCRVCGEQARGSTGGRRRRPAVPPRARPGPSVHPASETETSRLKGIAGKPRPSPRGEPSRPPTLCLQSGCPGPIAFENRPV